MLAANDLFLTINCAVVCDASVHSIRVPAAATFADLKPPVSTASLDLLGTATNSFTLLLSRRSDGQWLSTKHAEMGAIMSGNGVDALWTVFPAQVDSTTLADAFSPNHAARTTDIHVIAYPHGNILLVRDYTRCIRWLRRLQIAAAAVFVPCSIWAAVDAIGSQTVGTAACIAAVCTAIAGAAATLIQWCETARDRARAEVSATRIAELGAMNVA